MAPGPKDRPTVFIGSYDGRFYALDARSGSVLWERRAEGKISGGAVVLGDLVFYSTLNRHTTALGVATGQKVWTTGRGAFNPVVSNGRGIFLVGYTNLFGIDGRPPNPKKILAQRRHRRYVGRRAALRKKALAKRVAARRRAVHRRNQLRRSGVRFCYRSGGKRVCRRPAPLVCFKLDHGTKRTVRRPRVAGKQ